MFCNADFCMLISITVPFLIKFIFAMYTSGWTIKRELMHLVEVRSTRPVRTAFEIIDYIECEISE